MTTQTRERFSNIWRPVFCDGCPPEPAVADAWARTQRSFIERYGAALTVHQRRGMLGEMAIASLLRALAPSATATDTERASLALQAALALGVLRYDLDRVYEGYYRLLEGWAVYR